MSKTFPYPTAFPFLLVSWHDKAHIGVLGAYVMQLYSYWIIKVDVDKKLRSATTAPLFPFREYDAKRSAHGEEPSGVLDQTIRSLRFVYAFELTSEFTP